MVKNALCQEEKPPKRPYQTFLKNGTPLSPSETPASSSSTPERVSPVENSAPEHEAPLAPQPLLTAGACVWLYKIIDGNLFVLTQKRALTVHNGGFYDVSAGGHIDLGEDPLTAAVREAKEEIGVSLDPLDLEFLCAYRVPDKIVHIYLSDRTKKDDLFTLNYEEVESVEWVPLDNLLSFAQEHIKPTLRKEKFHLTFLADTLAQKLKS